MARRSYIRRSRDIEAARGLAECLQREEESDFQRDRYGHNHADLSEQAWTRIVYMARAKGYVMCRRPACSPFVLSEKQWLAFDLWNGQEDKLG